MGNEGRKTLGKGIYVGGMVALGVIFIIAVFTSLPVIEYRGNTIRMFAPERLLGRMPRIREITRPREPFAGLVLGGRVLETEHGEIRLGHFSYVRVCRGARLLEIGVENFRRGRASHNLVVEGITMPSDISISFAAWVNQQVDFLRLNHQEVSVSNVPLVIGNIHINSDGFTADIMVFAITPDDDITLADGTLIRFNPSSGLVLHALSIYKEYGQWKLIGWMGVIMPGGSTPVVYSSVTFEPNWGAFIEGVPMQ